MNDILKTTMAVITAIAVMAVVFVPMTMEFEEQAHYTTNRNTGGYYTLAESNNKVVVEIDNISPTATINGKEYDVSKFGSYLISDFALMTFVPQENTTSYHAIFTTELAYKLNVGSTPAKILITFYNGTATMELTTSSGSNTYTGEYSYVLHYSGGAGNYIQPNSSNASYMMVNADSEIFFIKNGGNTANSLIAGPFKASALRGTGTQYTLSGNMPTGAQTTVTWTMTDNGNGTYSIPSGTYGEDQTIAVSLVPVKYQVYNEDSMIAFIVNILPILVGLAFLAGIGMYITRFKSQ